MCFSTLSLYNAKFPGGTGPALSGKITAKEYVIPGSKGRKTDASLLAGGFLTWGPAKNMSK